MARANVDRRYLASVRVRLDHLFETARSEEYHPATDRVIVFSDHHRGTGDGADDFRHCEHAYTAALGYYLESGYRLMLLGDVEELWEVTKPAKIFARYNDVMRLERAFEQRGGVTRFWGNHDDRWSRSSAVRNELRSQIGGAPMLEGLKLQVYRGSDACVTMLFAHGHQGTPDGDRFSALSRLPVRYLWTAIQRWQGATATTPAHDHALRAKHDVAMFEWAREQRGRILIAGHTHKPVFAGSTPDSPVTRSVPDLEAALAEARTRTDGTGQPGAAAIAAELEYARTLIRRPDVTTSLDPPCYFNTGCCSFPDGDITGIELADGEIRLVRWPANLAEFRRPGDAGLDPGKRILASAALDAVLDAVAHPRAGATISQLALAPPPVTSATGGPS